SQNTRGPATRRTFSDAALDTVMSASVQRPFARGPRFFLHHKEEKCPMTRAILLCSGAAVIFAAIAPALAQNGINKSVTYTVTALPNPLVRTYAQGSSINNRKRISGFPTLAANVTRHAILSPEKQNPIDM